MDQFIIYSIIGFTIFLFIYGRWRYDVIAILALLEATLTGLVSPSEAFLGFGHPAVVTVAAVLALGTGLQNSGVVDFIYRLISKFGKGFWSQLTLMCIAIVAISAFMNNIGAMAILLPVALQVSRKCKKPPSQFLMPVAFSSLLGGMITMIGTPSNIIVAMLRKEIIGSPFGMFDFSYVGLGVAIAGVMFVVLIGWRFIPSRKGRRGKEDIFQIEDYLIELKVRKESTCIGKKVREIETFGGGEVSIVGIIRRKKSIAFPSQNEKVQGGDILIAEVESEALQEFVHSFKLQLLGDKKLGKEILEAGEMMIVEAVVKKDASVLQSEVENLNLKRRFGVNLLAVSRAGKKIKERLSKMKIQAGDVLLLRGYEQSLYEALPNLGCFPLQSRALTIGEPRRIVLSLSIFFMAILAAASGYLQIQISFVLGVVVMYFLGLLKLRDIYESVDWPIIILLGALIPVGHALETTGAAKGLSEQILWLAEGYGPTMILVIILVGTMFLSDLVNNATAAILMVPIAANLASSLHVSPDPFLMGVAIGASCPFLTPIGHQCNMLILGPGGYHFKDYCRLGLPLEIVIVVVAIPLILLFWPY